MSEINNRNEFVTQLKKTEIAEQKNSVKNEYYSINKELLSIMGVEDNTKIAREYVSISNNINDSLKKLTDQNDLLPDENPLKEELGSGLLFAQVEYLMNNQTA